MHNGDQTIDQRFEDLRNRLKELTEMPQLAETPFRFVALIGQHESNPDSPENPFLNGEMYSAADVEDLGDMLGMLVNAVLENHDDHREAQRYLIECILEGMREYIDFEEGDEDE